MLQRSPTGTKTIGPQPRLSHSQHRPAGTAGARDESGPTQDSTYAISSPRSLDPRFPCTAGQKGFLGGLALKRAAGVIQVTQPHILPQLVSPAMFTET